MEKHRLEKPVQYTVRNYRKGDEVPLAKIFSECFGRVTPKMIRRWHKQAEIRPEDVFIGVVDGRPVSHVNLEFKQLHHGGGVYLKTAGVAGVCTDSDYRKKGMVTNLLQLALKHAQQEGYSNASLYTDFGGPGHLIYQRNGFVNIITLRTYTKYVDYPSIFARWVRNLNRSLKDSKIAARRLKAWEKSTVIHVKEVGVLSFRFKKNRFQRLKKPLRQPDVEFSTDVQTYTKILRGVVQWEDAAKTGKLTVKRGKHDDIEMLQRILKWDWRN